MIVSMRIQDSHSGVINISIITYKIFNAYLNVPCSHFPGIENIPTQALRLAIEDFVVLGVVILTWVDDAACELSEPLEAHSEGDLELE